MGEVKFGPGQTAVATPPATPTAAAPTTTALAVPQPPFLGDMIPSFDDIIMPRINLVHNIGKLMETFVPGSIVLGQQYVLFTAPVPQGAPASKPVGITVLGIISKRFVEKVPFGSPGITVNTEAEVLANGGTTSFKEHELKKASGIRLFQPLLDILVAVERPETVPDDDTIFVYSVDGKKFALARWALKGSAYTEAAKKRILLDRNAGCTRKNGYPSFGYSLSTRLNKYQNGNSAWVPVVQPRSPSTPAFLEFVNDIVGNPTQVKPVAPEAAVDAE